MQSVWSLVKPYLSSSDTLVSRKSSTDTLVAGEERTKESLSDEVLSYDRMVEEMRVKEYPQLRGETRFILATESLVLNWPRTNH